MGNETQPPLLLLNHFPAIPPPRELHHHRYSASYLRYSPEEDTTHGNDAMGESRRRRAVVVVVVACAILLAVGSGYLAGSRLAHHHDQNNGAHHYYSLSEAERLIYEKSASWKNKASMVSGLGCTPIMTKVCVKALMNQTDSNVDLVAFPTHLAVPRCLDSHAFCGEAKLGVTTGKCEAKVRHIEQFQVWHTDGSQSTVECEVHLECHCVALTSHTCAPDNVGVDSIDGGGGGSDGDGT